MSRNKAMEVAQKEGNSAWGGRFVSEGWWEEPSRRAGAAGTSYPPVPTPVLPWRAQYVPSPLCWPVKTQHPFLVGAVGGGWGCQSGEKTC